MAMTSEGLVGKESANLNEMSSLISRQPFGLIEYHEAPGGFKAIKVNSIIEVIIHSFSNRMMDLDNIDLRQKRLFSLSDY